MLKERQNARINTLTESIIKDRYCASHISIESKLHAHDFYEFVICVDGAFEHAYNQNSETAMEKGMFFLARPGEVHKINQKQGSLFSRDDVYVSKKKMKRICNAFSDTLFDKIRFISGPIICSVDYDKLKSISNAISRLSHVTEITAETESDHCFLIVKLLNEVFEKYICKKETALPKWLYEIKEKVSNPENFIIPLGDLLENSFYSRAYISTAFKKYMGETVVEYRNKLRVKYSVSMLAENSMSINVIAGALGWDNPNNYIIAFKKVYGVTPLQYRNSLLKTNN